MKIVIIDGHTLNPGDLSWDGLMPLGELTVFEKTAPEQLLARAKDADVLIANKQIIDKKTLAHLPNLKCICVSATGTNNVDLKAAKKQGVLVCNVIGYGSPSVAQHVFALLLEMTNRISLHNNSVQEGAWSKSEHFCYTLSPIYELSTLNMGIYGFGRIGQQVARIALAYDMRVFAHHKHPRRDAMQGVEFVDLETLFKQSNVVSLHAPLNEHNHQIINQQLLKLMPQPSFLINTGRGGLIHEFDLVQCLNNQTITAAGLDVLSVEPPAVDHPLIGHKNCIITPHIAWASKASRQRLLNETIANVEAFIAGTPRNIVS